MPAILRIPVLLLVHSLTCLCQKVLDLHSFDQSLDYETFASRWFNSGTSIPLEDHIVLSPSVSDRFGAQWHKYPLLTDNFELSFKVQINKPANNANPPNDQGFAFWYVHENVTSSMPSEISKLTSDVSGQMAARGWGLFGYKNQYNGLGLFFSNTRKGASAGSPTELKPSVSIVLNDGTKSIQFPDQVPSTLGSYWNYRHSSGLEVKLRVKPDYMLLQAKLDNGKDWVKLTEVTGDKMLMKIKPGGYIGFTSYVGPDKMGNPTKFGQHDAVHIHHVVVTNMDPNQVGEESVLSPPSTSKVHDSPEKSAEFLHDKSVDGIERAEGKAIHTLSRMIFKLISETEPLKKSMASAIATLQSRLTLMERSIQKLKDEIVNLSGHDMDAEFEAMKNELTLMSHKARSEMESKKQDLAQLKNQIDTSMEANTIKKKAASENVVKTLNEVDSRAKDLKSQVASRGSFTMYVALICLALVVVAGFALQAKLKKWEKKHLL